MKVSLFRWLAVLACVLFAGGEPAAAQTPPGPLTTQAGNSVYLPIVVKPSAPGAPIITAFTASPAAIPAGGSSVLAWQVSGATGVGINPGIGAVTGNSISVHPAATTEYTLTASNANGQTRARVTVTVQSSNTPAGFFVPGIADTDRPTAHPSVAVDPSGGVHLAFTPDTNTDEEPTRPAYYAYCTANCTSPQAFTITRLGQDVLYANLALDPAGRPRLLLTVTPANAPPYYQYATCNNACTNPASWSLTFLTGFTAPPNAWGITFGRIFAVDGLGRPRFVYQDWGDGSPEAHAGNFYAYCDTGCTDPANWYEVLIGTDLLARVFELDLAPAGQPRLVWTSYDADNVETFLSYLECNTNCGSGGSWSGFRMLTAVSGSVEEFASYALETTQAGKPRLAYYTGTGSGGDYPANYLYYLSCDAADCGQPQGWRILSLGLPFTHGEAGVDLALDGQDRPRLAYHAPVAAGFGLYYTWCEANCESSAVGWQNRKIEASEALNQELPIPPNGGCPFPQCNPPVPACTISTWDTGVRPALALDTAGNPRIAYDADHEQGGACPPFKDTRLTRFIQFMRP